MQLALDKACELKQSLEAKEREKLELERRDMERLRLAYLAKSESQGLRRDMGELLEIKRQVRQHLQTAAGPLRTPVTAMPEHRPQPWTASASASASQRPLSASASFAAQQQQP